MKKQIITFCMLFVLAVLWGCNNSDGDGRPTLEESLEAGIYELALALDSIYDSKGFRVVKPFDSKFSREPKNASLTKSGLCEEDYVAYIEFDEITGIYNYTPLNPILADTNYYYRTIYEKENSSDLLTIRIPKEKAFNYQKLYMKEEGDNALTNDFVLTATDYTYRHLNDYETIYIIDATVKIENEFAGRGTSEWLVDNNTNRFKSTYKFTEGYSAHMENNHYSEDSIVYEYKIVKNGLDLYKESIYYNKTNDITIENAQIIICFSNVKIKKDIGTEEFKIFQDSTQIERASLNLVNPIEDISNLAFCQNNIDFIITFPDGESVILSQLLGKYSYYQLKNFFMSFNHLFMIERIIEKVAIEFNAI